MCIALVASIVSLIYIWVDQDEPYGWRENLCHGFGLAYLVAFLACIICLGLWWGNNAPVYYYKENTSKRLIVVALGNSTEPLTGNCPAAWMCPVYCLADKKCSCIGTNMTLNRTSCMNYRRSDGPYETHKCSAAIIGIPGCIGKTNVTSYVKKYRIQITHILEREGDPTSTVEVKIDTGHVYMTEEEARRAVVPNDIEPAWLYQRNIVVPSYEIYKRHFPINYDEYIKTRDNGRVVAIWTGSAAALFLPLALGFRYWSTRTHESRGSLWYSSFPF